MFQDETNRGKHDSRRYPSRRARAETVKAGGKAATGLEGQSERRCGRLLLDAEDAPQPAAELKALLRSVEVIAGRGKRSARHR